MSEVSIQACPSIAVLSGGTSAERAVSAASAAAVHAALEGVFTVRSCISDTDALPVGIPAHAVCFPAWHGDYGEDGGLQRDLEAADFVYAGSDAASSALCFDKPRAKAQCADAGLPLAGHSLLDVAEESYDYESLKLPEALAVAEKLVLKPTASGSSLGVRIFDTRQELLKALQTLQPGRWMLEAWVPGVEVTVGVLDGRALTPVEIEVSEGFYDYTHKYASTGNAYHVPARLPEVGLKRLQAHAEAAFRACGCRDFARIDFIVTGAESCTLLEINTLPGLTAQSLMPKSAMGEGLTFVELLKAMLAPALQRHRLRSKTPNFA